MKYTIEIRNSQLTTRSATQKLKRNGFRFQPTGKYSGFWHKETTSEREAKRWRKFCRFRFDCRVYNKELHERGKNYREDYFKANPPTANGKYHCAYCGRKLKRADVVVDHLIPVHKAKISRYWQKRLLHSCEGNVNHPNNLVSSCCRCNSKKGAKTSFWIIRGMIGKHYGFWIIVKLFFWVTLLYAAWAFRIQILEDAKMIWYWIDKLITEFGVIL